MANPNSNSTKIGQIVIIILLIILASSGCSYVYNKINDKVENVTSNINGKNYEVRSDQEKKEDAANHLASISERVDNLVDYMLKNNLPNKEIAERLKNRWGGCKFRETASHESTAAYTINKGDEMRLCVRDGNKIENLNTSMFVVLHELGHIMSISYGHNEEFRENFSYIVHLASALGFYKPEDFENKPVNYCGTEINTTPCMSGTCEYTSIPYINQESFRNTRGVVNLYAGK